MLHLCKCFKTVFKKIQTYYSAVFQYIYKAKMFIPKTTGIMLIVFNGVFIILNILCIDLFVVSQIQYEQETRLSNSVIAGTSIFEWKIHLILNIFYKFLKTKFIHFPKSRFLIHSVLILRSRAEQKPLTGR